MDVLQGIIDYIARTNLFNFIIFAGIIAFLVKKLDVKKKLEDAKVSVKDTIMESETARVESETKLSSIEESISNLEEEIDVILNESEENAKLVGEKIISDAKNAVLVIQDNSAKAIENSRMILKNDLIRRASLASIEVAKARIIQELSQNSELHNKLIEESIEQIEGAEL